MYMLIPGMTLWHRSERLVFHLLFLLGKHKGEYLAVCLSPSSPALVDRRTHTSRSFVKWFPYMNTHMHTDTHPQHTHAKLPPFTPAYLFLVVCILLLSWRWHTCMHTHTHILLKKCAQALFASSRVIHASFQITVLIKCSQKRGES